jgi:hypothetical protein
MRDDGEKLVTEDHRVTRLYGPIPPLDLTDSETLAAWISRVRHGAFLSGARHGDIDRAEARELLAALQARPIPADDAAERAGIAIYDRWWQLADSEGFVDKNTCRKSPALP